MITLAATKKAVTVVVVFITFYNCLRLGKVLNSDAIEDWMEFGVLPNSVDMGIISNSTINNSNVDEKNVTDIVKIVEKDTSNKDEYNITHIVEKDTSNKDDEKNITDIVKIVEKDTSNKDEHNVTHVVEKDTNNKDEKNITDIVKIVEKDTSNKDEHNVTHIVEKDTSNKDGKNTTHIVQKTKKGSVELEECGCPESKTIQWLMRRNSGFDCRLSDCTNYKLDLSKFEKPDQPYKRYDGVVMVTKVLWGEDLAGLKQLVCTFNAAYNRHAGYYDIVAFTSVPWTKKQERELQEVAFPANLTVVVDSPPIEDVLATMSDKEVAFLKKRCGCGNETLSWFHHCEDPGERGKANLGYSWQAEFRAYHLWNHPSLAKYKYMIWMDSDVFPTKMWFKDPIKEMIENDLVLMYANDRGHSDDRASQSKMMEAYNQTVIDFEITPDGLFKRNISNVPIGGGITDVHGFHHITNMDFYRSERTMKFLKLWVGDYKFSRRFDDQAAVTIPAAMDAPNRSWHNVRRGMDFKLQHNGKINGRNRNIYTGYQVLHWSHNRYEWDSARMCDLHATVRG